MRLLIIEDDPDSVKDVVRNLNRNYIVDVAYSGNEGAYLSTVNDYDAILIDSSLPDMETSEICKVARDSKVNSPILVLNEYRNDIDYKVKALDSGADGFIPKPLNTEEIDANLRVLVRRSGNGVKNNNIEFGKFLLDLKNKEFFYQGKLISLRRKEYELIQHLMVNKNRIVPKEELLDHIWEDGICSMSNTLEVHVRSIRKKVDEQFGISFIVTVKGFGYVVKDK